METLTPREREIAGLAHKSNAEIAGALNLTVSTVKSHLNEVYRKLGLNSTSTCRTTVVLMVERGEI
jgi:DNA-binding CsgD family transcriptional regulator